MSNQSNTAAAFPIGGVLGVGEGQGTLPEAAPLSVPTEREDGPSDQPFDWSEYEDDISDAISDSIDMDWSARDGAKAVIRCLAALSASGPSGGGGDDAMIGRDFLNAIEAALPDYPWLASWSPAESYGELIGDLLDIAFPDAPVPQFEAGGSGWLPIETAPTKERVEVLLIGLYPDGKTWSDIYQSWSQAPYGDDWAVHWARWPHGFPPTHWIPLTRPALSAPGSEKGAGE